MGEIWFTSDLHVGHRLCARLRGFGEDTEAHDRALAQRWDAVVRPDDQVWVLGDISIGSGAAERRALAWIAHRPGVKHLVAGNHDPCHPLHSRSHLAQRRFLGVFESVQSAATRKIAGDRVTLSHFPYRDDPDGDHSAELRHNEWRPVDTGGWLLHGHTHSDVQQRGRQLHVGVDAHGLAPVALGWIEERIAGAVVGSRVDPVAAQRDTT
ncbi:metallophosphoesterase [Nocardia higoensis]|uniref:Metallophosphoesterase n=1 Tax=Nocardia higoensis TaxID=228599 RepID=A0ABS0D968_9NOCA|nr:metallophosphoesterase [Nocardia higoensis]MBF6353308.1 metallophosphoesterase [Nocardia higoensis]